MKQSLHHETYPLYSLEVEKRNCHHQDLDSIIEQLKQEIGKDPLSSYINVFDHLEHLRDVPNAHVDQDILNAKSVLFCYGLALPTPQAAATNPRIIGVVEMNDSFVITFLQTPMPVINTHMEKWAELTLANN